MKILFALLPFLLIACTQQGPKMHAFNPNTPQFDQVRTNTTHYQGQAVRWGGLVAEVRNDELFSEVTMVQFPLTRFGKPISTQPSSGRFMVRSASFLDPVIFEKGALVTYIGKVDSSVLIKVDQKTITVPVITLIQSHTWPENYGERGRPYNPKQDARFIGYGYYGTGSYSP